MRNFKKKLFHYLSFTDACINQEHTFSSLKCLPCRYNAKYQCVKVQCVLPIFTKKNNIADVNESWWSALVFSSSIERLRAERLQREAEERRRAAALLEQRNKKGKESGREVTERDRPYNSAYFPELARKRQRRDRESWRDEILKSWAGGVCAQTLKRQTWACVEASVGDVIVLIKLVRHILLLTEKVGGRVQLRFWPCRVLLIITPTRQMAASRGAQRKHSETWSEQLLQSPLPKNKRK